jgi:hypothetical protein
MLGEIGGLNNALRVVFSIVVGLFAPTRMYAYLAAALYRDDPNEKEHITDYLSIRNNMKSTEDPKKY